MNSNLNIKNVFNCEKFYLLNIARTFAALSVVFLHYQHFYYIGDRLNKEFKFETQPFYEILERVYLFGSVAVQFFFVLSGFIFFFAYKNKIYSKKINFKNFLILRISRLWPLHLLTLFMVAFLQLYHIQLNELFFVYSGNDLKNFFLHFFLIQEWRLEAEFGFNGPSWSLSVEIFLYVAYFFIARKTLNNLFESFFFLILLLIINYLFGSNNIIIGLICFYIGGLTFFISRYLIFLNKPIYKLIFLFVIILLDIIIFGKFLNLFFLEIGNYLKFFLGERILFFLYFIKFPLIIINLTLIQNIVPDLGKSLNLFGEISYTIYLIHFPIQLIFSLINNNISRLDFSSNNIFLIYIFTVFLVSILVFIIYENPVKKIMRLKFLEK